MSTPPVLLGSYDTPAVRVGAVVYCRFRRARCRVTSFTDAPIPWPRCRAPKAAGAPGLLVTAALVRALRTESAAALVYWFGVNGTTAWRWRAWLGVAGRRATPGSRRLHDGASAKGAEASRGRAWTDAARAAARAAARRSGARPVRWAEAGWTAEQLALLGTDSDEAVAARVGRTPSAVKHKRLRLRMPLPP